jgi:hypothetical protein
MQLLLGEREEAIEDEREKKSENDGDDCKGGWASSPPILFGFVQV